MTDQWSGPPADDADVPVDAAAVLADDQAIEALRARHAAAQAGTSSGDAAGPDMGVPSGDAALRALSALLDDITVDQPPVTAPAVVLPLARRTGRVIAAGSLALATLSIGGVAAAADVGHPLRPLRDAVTTAAGTVASSAIGSAVGSALDAALPGDRGSGDAAARRAGGRGSASPSALPSGVQPSGSVASGSPSPGAQPSGGQPSGVPSSGVGAPGQAVGPGGEPVVPPDDDVGTEDDAPGGRTEQDDASSAGGQPSASPQAAGPVATGGPSSGTGGVPTGAPSGPTGAATSPVIPTIVPTVGPNPVVSGTSALPGSRPSDSSDDRPSAGPRQGATGRAAEPSAVPQPSARTGRAPDDGAADAVDELLDDADSALDRRQRELAGRLLDSAAGRLESLSSREAAGLRARLRVLRARYEQLADGPVAATVPAAPTTRAEPRLPTPTLARPGGAQSGDDTASPSSVGKDKKDKKDN